VITADCTPAAEDLKLTRALFEAGGMVNFNRQAVLRQAALFDWKDFLTAPPEALRNKNTGNVTF